MKWIGQHIWSLISRFRSDVYLETVESGTITSGGNLGLDSNNKIVKGPTKSTFAITAGSAAGEHDGDVVYTGGTTLMTAGKLYYYKNDGTWALANAATPATSTGLLAIALGAESDTHGMLLRGMVTTSAVAGTPDEGAILYVRNSVGDISTLSPGSGTVHRIVGYCMENSNNRIWFDPDKTWVEIA
tara:strand:- start:94 stop:651 length:558 start_codon:yes stop_codon:yes gene_type:complete